MSDFVKVRISPRDLPAWATLFALALLAWILLLYQMIHMPGASLSMVGTMGLTPGPFLVFWTLMVVAMMFPTLAPVAVLHYSRLYQDSTHRSVFAGWLAFLAGYTFPWTILGLPVFFLSWLGEKCIFYAPALGIGLGVALLFVIGLYQMTPLATCPLQYCAAASCGKYERSFIANLVDGLRHSLSCMRSCGGLMLVMVVVGLMNLPWMVLLTAVMGVKKIWRHGERFGFFVGFSLLLFAALALAEPALMSGLI